MDQDASFLAAVARTLLEYRAWLQGPTGKGRGTVADALTDTLGSDSHRCNLARILGLGEDRPYVTALDIAALRNSPEVLLDCASAASVAYIVACTVPYLVAWVDA